MRLALVTLSLVLGATVPRHRHFQQPNLQAASAVSTGCPALTSCTSGVTNVLLYSEQLDNATAWTTTNGAGAAVPLVTANYATSPDGTMTAERIQFGNCLNLGSYSLIYQNNSPGGAHQTASIYCLGTSADQSISVCGYAAGGSNSCTAILCPSSLNSCWARGAQLDIASNTGGGVNFGCNNIGGSWPGGGNTGDADVIVWGAQVEMRGTTSGYVKSVGTAGVCP